MCPFHRCEAASIVYAQTLTSLRLRMSPRSLKIVRRCGMLQKMINQAQIQQFIDTKPFRQFALETTGGNYLVVQTPDHIKLPPSGFDLINIFGADGLVHYVPLDAVLSASVYGPTPTKD